MAKVRETLLPDLESSTESMSQKISEAEFLMQDKFLEHVKKSDPKIKYERADHEDTAKQLAELLLAFKKLEPYKYSDMPKKIQRIADSEDDLSDDFKKYLETNIKAGSAGTAVQRIFKLRWILQTKWMMLRDSNEGLGLGLENSFIEKMEDLVDKAIEIEEVHTKIAEKIGRYYYHHEPGDPYNRSTMLVEGDHKIFSDLTSGIFSEFVTIDIESLKEDLTDENYSIRESGVEKIFRTYEAYLLGNEYKDEHGKLKQDKSNRTRLMCSRDTIKK